MNTTTTAIMFLEFYRADGSWIGAAAAGAELQGEFEKADKIAFEGRIELVTHDENGDLVE